DGELLVEPGQRPELDAAGPQRLQKRHEERSGTGAGVPQLADRLVVGSRDVRLDPLVGRLIGHVRERGERMEAEDLQARREEGLEVMFEVPVSTTKGPMNVVLPVHGETGESRSML